MVNVFKVALAVLGGGTVVVAGLSYLIKRIVTSAIDAHFERTKEVFQTRVALDREWTQRINNQTIVALPALLSLAYKAKLAAEQLQQSRTVIALANDTILEAARELSATLVSYRLYVEPKAFRALHDFKHAVQDLRLHCDRITRRVQPIDLSPEETQVIAEASGRVVLAFEIVDRELGIAARAPKERLS
jgi:hypothetical protein